MKGFTLRKEGDKLVETELWNNAEKAVQFCTPLVKGEFVYGMTGTELLGEWKLAALKSCLRKPNSVCVYRHSLEGRNLRWFSQIALANIWQFGLRQDLKSESWNRNKDMWI